MFKKGYITVKMETLLFNYYIGYRVAVLPIVLVCTLSNMQTESQSSS